uniref:PA domain-containing protein n=1 Tax=Parascaris equorum TaxID=6256 RepID=A0A914RCL3_PAREQ
MRMSAVLTCCILAAHLKDRLLFPDISTKRRRNFLWGAHFMECSFAKKALMASKAGARFALITDSAAGTDDWIDMVGDGTAQKSDIPVAYLPGVSG